MSEPAAPPTLHGVVIVVRDAGVLIRGRSGAGKSRLGEDMIGGAQTRGWFGRLVADDRVRFVRRGGRLVLSPHPAIAGLVERRGEGVMPIEHEPSVVLRLVVDLVDVDPGKDRPPRLPDDDERQIEIAGVRVPRLTVAAGDNWTARAALRIIAEGA